MTNLKDILNVNGNTSEQTIQLLVGIRQYLELYAQAVERGDVNDSVLPDYAQRILKEADSLKKLTIKLISLNELEAEEPEVPLLDFDEFFSEEECEKTEQVIEENSIYRRICLVTLTKKKSELEKAFKDPKFKKSLLTALEQFKANSDYQLFLCTQAIKRVENLCSTPSKSTD